MAPAPPNSMLKKLSTNDLENHFKGNFRINTEASGFKGARKKVARSGQSVYKLVSSTVSQNWLATFLLDRNRIPL